MSPAVFRTPADCGCAALPVARGAAGLRAALLPAALHQKVSGRHGAAQAQPLPLAPGRGPGTMHCPYRAMLWRPAATPRTGLPGTARQSCGEPAWHAADRVGCGCRAGGWRCAPSRSSPTWAPGGAAATASPATGATTPRTRCPPPHCAMLSASDCGCKTESKTSLCAFNQAAPPVS
jgi:hypothetical protein